MITRRSFLKRAAAGTAIASFGGILPGFSARSYANIVGANERINAAVIGVNSRGKALAQNFAKQPNCQVTRICDVDSRALSKCIAAVDEITGQKPAGDKDLRKTFEHKDVDAVVIAMPDHWHAPAALLAMKAGKHVYLEKPCSHTPAEGEMLVEAAKRYKRVVQMGNQRRSWPNIVEAINEIKAGTIGNVYFGKSWYTNNRPSIGTGKETAVPEWLDWELWQGPAPRTAYKDNFLHYNWHWFWRWGTGEALNNGTHMVDLLRWGMDLDFPTAVTSTGGRYYYKDDWEAPDTQVINLDFGGKKSMMWEGHCCNPFRIEGEVVGLLFYGEKANLLIGGGNEYKILDHKNQVIKHVTSKIQIDPRNKMNPAQQLDALHIQNFFDGITKGTPLHADILSGHKSTLLVQLGNIAQRSSERLLVDPSDGHIRNKEAAGKYWARTYEKGWEMKL
ncbi:Gfo/Idh/MocA family oxidoreductase [uncultured Parabacteroides sp.]|jgi:predicted dehydrogenase|uniref:Gfo/Idh/MocA family oxidoreductase n=1 Tax=uncultured Parabacteroides sp. TaxID=512312 RepID=UPI002600A513|nr:Gfo/Idh/MocA family oxidoreductase [uncultured Parabacteroides sp.]